MQTVTISLAFDLECEVPAHLFTYLRAESDRRGISPGKLALQFLAEHENTTERRVKESLESSLKQRPLYHLGLARRGGRIVLSRVVASLNDLIVNILANRLTIIEFKHYLEARKNGKSE